MEIANEFMFLEMLSPENRPELGRAQAKHLLEIGNALAVEDMKSPNELVAHHLVHGPALSDRVHVILEQTSGLLVNRVQRHLSSGSRGSRNCGDFFLLLMYVSDLDLSSASISMMISKRLPAAFENYLQAR